MHRESEVLVNADIVPPNAQGILVIRFIWLDATLTPQRPSIAFMIEPHGRHQLLLPILMNFPTPHVVTTGDDPGFDSFSNPCTHNEVTNFSFHADQIAGAQA